jgi:hypothetical protein
MAILTLKSKVKVRTSVVNTTSLDYILMDIEEESRNALAITVTGRYKEYETNEFIKSFNFSVTNNLANQLGESIIVPNGTSLINTRNLQLTEGVLSILEQYKDFGLNAIDWEII